MTGSHLHARIDKDIYHVTKIYHHQWHRQTMSTGANTTNNHERHIQLCCKSELEHTVTTTFAMYQQYQLLTSLLALFHFTATTSQSSETLSVFYTEICRFQTLPLLHNYRNEGKALDTIRVLPTQVIILTNSSEMAAD